MTFKNVILKCYFKNKTLFTEAYVIWLPTTFGFFLELSFLPLLPNIHSKFWYYLSSSPTQSPAIINIFHQIQLPPHYYFLQHSPFSEVLGQHMYNRLLNMHLCVPDAQSILLPSLVLEALAILSKCISHSWSFGLEMYSSFPGQLLFILQDRKRETHALGYLSSSSHAHPICRALSFMKAALGTLHRPWPQSY